MSKTLRDFIKVLKDKDVNPDVIHESYRKMKIKGNELPDFIKEEILKSALSNNGSLWGFKNLLKLSELGCVPDGVESDDFFVMVSLSENWKDLYDFLLDNDISPSCEDVKGLSGFTEKMLYAGEYEKISYLNKRDCGLKIRKFNNIVDSFIMSMNIEGIKLSIECGLWNTENNMASFYRLDKDVQEKETSDIIDYLDEHGVLDNKSKRMICLSLLVHDNFSFEFTKRKFEELNPDFSCENFLLFNVACAKYNIYDVLIKDDGIGLSLCEQYKLRLDNLSPFSVLKSCLKYDYEEDSIKAIYDKLKGSIHKVDFEELILASFRKGKVELGLFLTTQTEKNISYYYAYRKTVQDFTKGSEAREFIDRVEKYFPEYINKKGLSTESEKDLSAVVLAFCFDIDKFNTYYNQCKIESLHDVILLPIMRTSRLFVQPLIDHDEFIQSLLKSALSFDEKKRMMNVVKLYTDEKLYTEMLGSLCAGTEKKTIEELVEISDDGVKKKRRM